MRALALVTALMVSGCSMYALFTEDTDATPPIRHTCDTWTLSAAGDLVAALAAWAGSIELGGDSHGANIAVGMVAGGFTVSTLIGWTSRPGC